MSGSPSSVPLIDLVSPVAAAPVSDQLELATPPAPRRASGERIPSQDIHDSPFIPNAQPVQPTRLVDRMDEDKDDESTDSDSGSDSMPVNYCNRDLGDAMSGNFPNQEAERLTDVDNFLNETRRHIQDELYARSVANEMRVGYHLSEEQASGALFEKSADLENRVVKEIYKRIIARHPEQAIYLRVRWEARFNCDSCSQFCGVGHEEGCAMDDKRAIYRYVRKALVFLGLEYYDVNMLEQVLTQQYKRTFGELERIAEHRAKDFRYDYYMTRDLEFEPLRKPIQILTEIAREKASARFVPEHAIHSWISFLTHGNKEECETAFLRHWGVAFHRDHDLAERGWDDSVDAWFRDAVQVLEIPPDAATEGLKQKVKDQV